MARRPKAEGLAPLADMGRIGEILEQELSRQRAALERLKQLGVPAKRPITAQRSEDLPR